MPLLLVSMALAGEASADTVALTPLKDNTLIETPVGNSNGAGDVIFVGRTATGAKRRGLVAFELSSIPQGSTINLVTLNLQMVQATTPAAQAVTLFRVSADWGEAGSAGASQGGPAQPGDATWIYSFFNTTAWTIPGGDFVAGPSDSQSVADVGPYTWTGAGLVADVQFWLNHPSSNFGWLLMGNETVGSTIKKFTSREGLTPPLLSIDFTPPNADVAPRPGAEIAWFAPPWPAPSSGFVNLGYTLQTMAPVSLSIHDVAGRLVRRLASGIEAPAGRHALVWDGRGDSGDPVASGSYLASLRVGNESFHRTITLLR